MKKTEKNLAKIMLVLSAFVLMGWFFLEPADGAVTMSAEVSSMITCTTPMTSNNFGAIDNTAIYSASTSTTTISSNGSVYMKVYDAGDGAANPGLYKAPDLIRSPNYALSASTTLVISTEGYGIMATTTSTSMLVGRRYIYASSTNIVGGIPYGVGASQTVASSAAAVSVDVVRVDYKAAVSATTTSGNYTDTVTYSCSSS